MQAKIDKLDLALKCLQLRSWRDRNANWLEHRKFLVTDICGSSWPAHYPIIAHTRTNDGQGSADPQPVPLPAPYKGAPRSKDANEDTVVRSDLDANAGSSTTIVRGSPWSWLDQGPQYRRLVKEQSQRYQAGLPSIDNDGTEVSPGAHTFEKDALPKAEVKTLVRAPNARFSQMYKAFRELADTNIISDLNTVSARRFGQRVDRGGFECWTFIDDEPLRLRLKPKGGFRTIYDKPRDRSSAYWRTALILHFEYRQRTHHWIEIECNSNNSFRSLLLTIDPTLIPGDVIETALNAIAEARGTGLERAVRSTFLQEPIGIFAYTHHYTNAGMLRVDLLRAFLDRSVAAVS